MSDEKMGVEVTEDEDETRYRVEVVNGAESPPSATGPSLNGAVAHMLQMAFREGVKFGKSQANDEACSPMIGPFFSEDDVSVLAGSPAREGTMPWTEYDYEPLEDSGLNADINGDPE